MRNNPDKINYILNQNERYIFFKIANESLKNPLGAIGMELIPFISIAIDKKYYPLGIPFVLYEKDENSYKIVLGMDTGSAIKGKNRADLFTGSGEKAESVAGMMKNKFDWNVNPLADQDLDKHCQFGVAWTPENPKFTEYKKFKNKITFYVYCNPVKCIASHYRRSWQQLQKNKMTGVL